MRMASAIPSGSEPDLVEVSEHRDEVGDEVDRTERVRDDCSCERIRVPRRARVAAASLVAQPSSESFGMSCRAGVPYCVENSGHGVGPTKQLFDTVYDDPAECSIFRVRPRSGPNR